MGSSNSVSGAVKPPFSLQLFNYFDESNFYTKISNSNYLKMRRLNFDPNLSIGIFNLRFRIEFTCDTKNCVMEVMDPFNRVIISKGNRRTQNNAFVAILGFPNSCNHEMCQVIVFDMLNWNNRLITKETLPTTAQNSTLNSCGFNFDFSHSCDDHNNNCILNVSNSRGKCIIVNMIKSDVNPFFDAKEKVLGFVFFVIVIAFVTAFVIYFIKLSYMYIR